MRSDLLARWLGAEFDAYDAPRAPQVRGVGSDREAEALLQEVDQVLDSGQFDVRFSAQIARRFEENSREARTDLFVRLAVVGTIVYDLFLLIDAIVVPDAIRLALLLQLGVGTPICLAMIVGIRRFRLDVNVAAVTTLLTMAACTVAIFMASRSAHVALFPAIFPLFLLSANVAQALPFKHAASVTGTFILAFSAAVFCHPSLDPVTRTFAIVLLVAAANYSLSGNYRINAGMRRAYLFALRESLRAQLLSESNSRLTTMVDVDSLTGVGNRRRHDHSLDRLWSCPDTSLVAMLLIDIDRFKTLNDTFGHQVGDDVLRRVAHCLSEEVGTAGIVSRYGGEEFTVILADHDAQSARFLSERLRRGVEGLAFAETDPDLRVTISIGGASVRAEDGIRSADLVAAADAALYVAKASGRNRSEFAPLAHGPVETREIASGRHLQRVA